MANNMRSLSSMNRSVGVDVMGTDYISCPTHPNYFITNMCVAQVNNIPHYTRNAMSQFVQSVSMIICNYISGKGMNHKWKIFKIYE